MAKLPGSFSMQAVSIRSALAEGRTEDARTLMVELLRAGKADPVVQALVADMLKPSKRSRGRQKTSPQHWFEIGEEFHRRRDAGERYEDALRLCAEKFCFSETHVRKAVGEYDAAREAHDAASRE